MECWPARALMTRFRDRASLVGHLKISRGEMARVQEGEAVTTTKKKCGGKLVTIKVARHT